MLTFFYVYRRLLFRFPTKSLHADSVSLANTMTVTLITVTIMGPTQNYN